MRTILLKASFLVILSILLSTLSFSQKGIEDGSKFGHGQDSINCMKNLSLYFEFYNHKNYNDAIVFWRQVVKECPAARVSTFGYGIEMYKYFLENATDPALKTAYCDTIMMLHDQRIKYFGEEGKVLGIKGVDLLRYRRTEGTEIIKKGYEILKKSLEFEKTRS